MVHIGMSKKRNTWKISLIAPRVSSADKSVWPPCLPIMTRIRARCGSALPGDLNNSHTTDISKTSTPEGMWWPQGQSCKKPSLMRRWETFEKFGTTSVVLAVYRIWIQSRDFGQMIWMVDMMEITNRLWDLQLYGPKHKMLPHSWKRNEHHVSVSWFKLNQDPKPREILNLPPAWSLNLSSKWYNAESFRLDLRRVYFI